jgi:two-component system sensor histidine kinase UhpB
MDLRRTLIARLALAFAALLLVFGVVWVHDLKEDALAEQKATSNLVDLLATAPDKDSAAKLANALTPGQFRHVKIQLDSATVTAPQTQVTPWLSWLGLSAESAKAHRIRVGDQMLWIRPDPESEFREKWSTSVQVLAMLSLFCAVCLTLTWYAVDHALSPVKELNAGLVRLAGGEDDARLPPFALREFTAMAGVVDQLAQSLAQGRERQRRLTQQLMEVQDKERRELAAELHDEFGQSLTAITATAAYIEHHAPHASTETLTECAREIGSESRRISGHVRQMLTSLRPYGLEESGMREALQELVSGWQARLPDRRIVSHIAPLPPLSADAALALYRSLQEGLTNVVRHSGADQIEVRCECLDERIALTVIDNGQGQAQALQAQAGSGLLGLKARLAMVGGTLNIADAHAGGIALTALLPARQETPA